MCGWLTRRPPERTRSYRRPWRPLPERWEQTGRILVRESGTEPLIRVMVEAGTEEICAEHVANVVKVMEAEGLIVE